MTYMNEFALVLDENLAIEYGMSEDLPEDMGDSEVWRECVRREIIMDTAAAWAAMPVMCDAPIIMYIDDDVCA